MGLPYSTPFPPSYFGPARVDLIVQEMRYEELLTSEAIPPGSLCQQVAGALAKHNVIGGVCEHLFALEHRFETMTGGGLPQVAMFDDWAASSIASFFIAKSGDVVLALATLGFSYTDGMYLCSAGDGRLMPLPAVSRAEQVLYETVAASTAISGVSTITAFSNGAYTIPANTLKIGDVIHVRVQVIATATNSTDTLTLTLKIGSTTIIATGAVDVANNDVGIIDAYLTIRTIGASGTFIANGSWVLGVPGTATEFAFALGSTAIDTTATQAVTAYATWSTTNAGNSVRMDQAMVEMVRSVSYVPIAIAVPDATLDLTTTTTTTTAAPGTTVPASISPVHALKVRII